MSVISETTNKALVLVAFDTLFNQRDFRGAEQYWSPDLVVVYGRLSGTGRPRNWIVATFVRIDGGRLVEQWDVMEDEASQAQTLSGRPMFGERFPETP